MKYKDTEKFLKYLICFTLIFLILIQPCFASGLPPLIPTSVPTLPHTNFTFKAGFLNNSYYPLSHHNLLINACSEIGEGLNSQTAFGLCFTSLSLRKASVHLTYDVENRLLTAQTPSYTASYGYDGFGRRISKTVDGVTTYFIYDGDQIIEERDANNQLIANYVYGTGIDEILLYTNYQQQTTNYYFHYDGLGSVTDITDSTGTVVESYNYDVYGIPSQLSTIGNRNYFTGREYDAETGLYYYRARYYNPSIGRFISRDTFTFCPDDPRIQYFSKVDFQLLSVINKADPSIRDLFYLLYSDYYDLTHIGLTDFSLLHMYEYTKNNPTNYIDPYGHIPVWLITAGIGTAFGFVSGIVGQRWSTGSWEGAFSAGLRGALYGGITGLLLPYGFVWGASSGGAAGAVDYVLFGGCNKTISGFFKSVVTGAVFGGIGGSLTKSILTPQ